MREFTGNRERTIRALLWLQRAHLSESPFDPTSERDEDLPFDVDHLIPQSKFGFGWDKHKERLDETVLKSSTINVVRYNRSSIGNSIGNLRCFSAEKNRARQDGKIDDKEGVTWVGVNRAQSIEDWNGLIAAEGKWSEQHLRKFQWLIDNRSLDAIECVIKAIEPAPSTNANQESG